MTKEQSWQYGQSATISKSDLLGRGLWDMACALCEVPAWESVEALTLGHQDLIVLGLRKPREYIMAPPPLAFYRDFVM